MEEFNFNFESRRNKSVIPGAHLTPPALRPEVPEGVVWAGRPSGIIVGCEKGRTLLLLVLERCFFYYPFGAAEGETGPAALAGERTCKWAEKFCKPAVVLCAVTNSVKVVGNCKGYIYSYCLVFIFEHQKLIKNNENTFRKINMNNFVFVDKSP